MHNMVKSMNLDVSWDDMYIACVVAEHGALSRAGQVLDKTHSTVLRHVDRLEEQLQVKLFIRHQRGYRLTDAGRMLVERMQPIISEVQRLQVQLRSQDATPTGTLSISTVSDFSAFFAPILRGFREEYPQTRVHVVATDEVLSLTGSDVQVAIRMGQQPREPDLIARRLLAVKLNYYASPRYIERFGLPRSIADIEQHYWVLPSGEKQNIPGIRALAESLPADRVAFLSNSFTDIHSAVVEGMGIGPIGGLQLASGHETQIQPVEFGVPIESANMWFVYHRDLRNSARIRALLHYILRVLPELRQKWEHS